MSYSLGNRMKDKSGGPVVRDKQSRRVLRKQAMALSRTTKRRVEVNGVTVVQDVHRPTIDGKLLIMQEERAMNPPAKVRGGLWGKKSREKTK